MQKKEFLRLDATDIQILQLIQKDAKLTNKEIAAKVGMTITPVYERIKRLEDIGVIAAYRADLNRHSIGYEMIAFCNISLKEHNKAFLDQFEEEVLKLDEVIECYHIAGLFDYLLKVALKDMMAYHNFIIGKLATIDNIGNVQSMFVMNEIKQFQGYTIHL